MKRLRLRIKLSLLLSVLAGSLVLASSSPRQAPADHVSDAPDTPVDPIDLYAPASRALRSKDCASAARRLAEAESAAPELNSHHLIEGLYAHACEDIEKAERSLFYAAGGARILDHDLEDWRLLILADTAAALRHDVIARASLARLLGGFPDSPLRPRALLQAAELAWRSGDASQTLAVIEQARREVRSTESLGRFDALAWQAGNALSDPRVRAEAARRLLTHAPLTADRLAVDRAFRSPGGRLDWRAILSVEDLQIRAETLLALDRLAEAWEAVDAIPREERDFSWHLLKAEILTRDHRGGDALSLLTPLAGGSAGEKARLAWARGKAAADLATARAGRENLPGGRRREIRKDSYRYYEEVVRAGGEPELSRRALRRLFKEFASEERFGDALRVLKRLRLMDPSDTSGAAHLWELGWEAYRKRNYTGALGIWTELVELYPEHRHTRSGRYWTGRAFEALGNRERAQGIFRQVADADTTDFYRKYALTHLGEEPGSGPEPLGEPEGWPREPLLDRARLLSDLGLNHLAATEASAFADTADSRSVAALESLIEARLGDRRTSIGLIRRAFPSLGGPHQATVPRQALELYYPLDYEATIRAAAAREGLPTHLIFAMIRQESGFDRRARSVAGAQGLMQLMPATGREIAGQIGLSFSLDRLRDPEFNVRLGTTYFKRVLRMFDGNEDLALAGYNSGPYRMKRLWSKAPRHEGLDTFLEGLRIRESKIYVKRILLLSDSYERLYESDPV